MPAWLETVAMPAIHDSSESDAPEGASEFTMTPFSHAWEFPLSRSEKVERTFFLFEQEIDHRDNDCATLEKENQMLRRQNATFRREITSLRAAVQRLASGGASLGSEPDLSTSDTEDEANEVEHRRATLSPRCVDAGQPQIRAQNFGGIQARMSLPPLLLPTSGKSSNMVQETPRWRRNIRQTVQLTSQLATTIPDLEQTVAQAQAQVQDNFQTVKEHASAQVQDFSETMEHVHSAASETIEHVHTAASAHVQDLSDTVLEMWEKASGNGSSIWEWGQGWQKNVFSPAPRSVAPAPKRSSYEPIDLLTGDA